MTSQILARRGAGSAQAFAAPRAARPARVGRLVCRAEEKSVAKTDRGKDVLHFSSSDTLRYLDGSRPGDFGFDPLGLMDPVNSGGFITPEWLSYAEVYHCRWAMLGAAGLIGPEILGKMGVIPEATSVKWFESGVIPPAGNYNNYWTDSWSLTWIEILLMQFAELRRLQDFRKPGSMGKQYFLGLEGALGGSGDPAYPGGPFFNVFNLGGSDPKAMQKLKLNEIKNGRLAMIAVFGYGAQATITRDGPFQNLVDHLADPIHNNLIGNLYKVYHQ